MHALQSRKQTLLPRLRCVVVEQCPLIIHDSGRLSRRVCIGCLLVKVY